MALIDNTAAAALQPAGAGDGPIQCTAQLPSRGPWPSPTPLLSWRIGDRIWGHVLSLFLVTKCGLRVSSQKQVRENGWINSRKGRGRVPTATIIKTSWCITSHQNKPHIRSAVILLTLRISKSSQGPHPHNWLFSVHWHFTFTRTFRNHLGGCLFLQALYFCYIRTAPALTWPPYQQWSFSWAGSNVPLHKHS